MTYVRRVALLAILVLLPASASGALPLAVPLHPPILIDGDDGFTEEGSGVRSGSGTPHDPYVIEGWTLVAGAGAAVHLRNTTAHVVLRELDVSGPVSDPVLTAACRLMVPDCRTTAGILAVDVSNVTIERVRIADVGVPVDLLRARDVHVRDVAAESYDLPLWVTESARVSVERATFESGFSAFNVEWSRDVTVRDVSTLDTIVPSGIHASERVKVEGGAFRGDGLYFTGLNRDVVVANGSFMDVSHAIAPAFIDDRIEGALFCGNVFRGVHNGYAAIEVRSSRGVVVRGNDVVHSRGGGINLQDAEGAVVEGNVLELQPESNFALGLAASTPAVVRGNSIVAPMPGVDLSGVVDARRNWWGDASGPSGDFLGSGTALRAEPGVAVEPWLDARPRLSVGC